MTVEEKSFSDAAQAAKALAADIAETLRQALAERGRASLIVPGGASPGPVFDVLAHADIDWAKVTVLLSDERMVPPDHGDSNEAMVRERLLTARAAMADFVSLAPREDEDPTGTAARLDPLIAGLPKPFDAVFLGMGTDTHTASLFPDNPALRAGGFVVQARSDAHPHWRLSLTGRALRNARRLFLIVGGEEKRLAYARAMAGNDIRECPVRLALKQNTAPVTVYLSD